MYIESNNEVAIQQQDHSKTDRKRIVLIVEDFDAIRAILSRHFTERGFDVYSTVTTRDAVKLASSMKPDIVIVDYDLSGESAANCVRQLHSFAESSRMVVMGGPDTATSKEIFHEAGAFKLMPKVYDMAALDDIINEVNND